MPNQNLSKATTISCVIPLYNESKTLEKVIRTVHSYSPIHEIIAINDGSKDNTLQILRKLEKELPKLIVIDQQPNQGKTAAVLSGIKRANGEVIVMCDGDLLTLKHKHFDMLLKDVLNHKYEMTILDKGSDRYKILGPGSYLFSRPLGGERAFWRKEFLKIPIKGTERFGLETLMNLYYVNLKKRIKSVYCPDLEAPDRFEKEQSLIKGLKDYEKTIKEIMKIGGVSGYLHQTVNLEEDRLSRLYDVKEKTKFSGSKKALSVIIFGAGILLSLVTFVYLLSKHSMNLKNLFKRSKP